MVTMAFTEPSIAAGQSTRQNGRYIPRLSYRTNSADVSSNCTMSTDFSSTATPSTVPTIPRYSIPTSMPSPRLPSETSISHKSQFSLKAAEPQYTNSVSGSSAAQTASSVAKPVKKDKKGGSFFNFVSVKEPSAQAFEEYQNAMRKKRGRATALGMPGVSSAKLPPTVPRVNSKWDGVPQAVKEKDKVKHSLRLSVSGSVPSQQRDGIAGQTAAPRSRAGSANSNGDGNGLAKIYGWDTASSSSSSVAKDFALEHVIPKKTASTTSLPETTLFPTHHPLPIRSVSEQPPPPSLVSLMATTPPPLPELPAIPAPVPELSGIPSNRVELHGMSAPIPELPGPLSANRQELHAASADITAFTRYPPPPSCVSELESPVSPIFQAFPNSPPPRNPLRPPPLPELQGDILSDSEPPAYQYSPSSTPPESSPVTPGFPFESPPLQNFPPSYHDPPVKDGLQMEVILHDPEEVILRSCGTGVLAPPAYVRRHPQGMTSQRHSFVPGEAEELTVLRNNEPQPHSILKWESSPKNVRPSLRKAFHNPDLARETSSNMVSVQERLLGGNKVSPVSVMGSPSSEEESERNTTPTPEGGSQSLRRKGRMRIFHKQ